MQQVSFFLLLLHTNEHITGNWNNLPIQMVRARMNIRASTHAHSLRKKSCYTTTFLTGLNRLVLLLWRLTSPTTLPLFFYFITLFDSRFIEEFLPGVTVL